MSKASLEYWSECLASSFDEHGVQATAEQIAAVADDVEGGHENYGMAFYQPPPSDRYNEIEREWKAKYVALQAEFDKYVRDAETAVKVALRRSPDANVTIGEYGEVRLHDGRSDRIQ